MTTKDVRRIVDAYNRWAKVWNRHELNARLPQSPRSDEGDIIGHQIRSALGWQDYETGRRCVIRIDGWTNLLNKTIFEPMLRRPVDPAKIVWAGWVL